MAAACRDDAAAAVVLTGAAVGIARRLLCIFGELNFAWASAQAEAFARASPVAFPAPLSQAHASVARSPKR